MKRRAANFELLRIISMMMVVCLHYLSKGNLLPQYIKLNHGSDYLYWLIEALCIVSVNVFVLISGYFLIEKEFNGKKDAPFMDAGSFLFIRDSACIDYGGCDTNKRIEYLSDISLLFSDFDGTLLVRNGISVDVSFCTCIE